jgi:hypothetical protein
MPGMSPLDDFAMHLRSPQSEHMYDQIVLMCGNSAVRDDQKQKTGQWKDSYAGEEWGIPLSWVPI